MPTKPQPSGGTPMRTIKIPNDMWAELLALAAEEYTTASAIVRELIRERLVKARKERKSA